MIFLLLVLTGESKCQFSTFLFSHISFNLFHYILLSQEKWKTNKKESPGYLINIIQENTEIQTLISITDMQRKFCFQYQSRWKHLQAFICVAIYLCIPSDFSHSFKRLLNAVIQAINKKSINQESNL